MTIRFRDLLLAGATLAAMAPAAGRAADAAAEVDELVVTGQLEETLPSKIAEYLSLIHI